MFVVLLIFAIIVFVYILAPWAFKIILRRRFLKDFHEEDHICLTFDDGPNPDATPQILDALEQAGVKATFYLVGENVEKYPDLAARIVELGHEIGEHGYKHTHAWKTGPITTARDLWRGSRTLARYQSEDRPLSFRPPYGKLNVISVLYILLGRKKVAFWNIDPRDYASQSADEISNEVLRKAGSGGVVLLHDGRRHDSNDAGLTVQAVRSLLCECRERKLTIRTVGEVLARRTRQPTMISASTDGRPC